MELPHQQITSGVFCSAVRHPARLSKYIPRAVAENTRKQRYDCKVRRRDNVRETAAKQVQPYASIKRKLIHRDVA